jgi:hypothetical protein
MVSLAARRLVDANDVSVPQGPIAIASGMGCHQQVSLSLGVDVPQSGLLARDAQNPTSLRVARNTPRATRNDEPLRRDADNPSKWIANEGGPLVPVAVLVSG